MPHENPRANPVDWTSYDPDGLDLIIAISGGCVIEAKYYSCAVFSEGNGYWCTRGFGCFPRSYVLPLTLIANNSSSTWGVPYTERPRFL
jgi:hypothetical protein